MFRVHAQYESNEQLPKTVSDKRIGTGSIVDLWNGSYINEPIPHEGGVLTQRVDEDNNYLGYCINGEPVYTGQCSECLPFGSGVIVRNGQEFFVDNRRYYKHPESVESCEVHPDEGIVVIAKGDSYTLTHIRPTRLGRKKVVLNEDRFDSHRLCSGGAVIRRGSSFYFNGKMIYSLPEGLQTRRWWALDKNRVLIATGEDRLVVNPTALTWEDDPKQNIVHDGSYDDCVVLRGGNVVVWKGSEFFLNGNSICSGRACEECWAHPFGVLIRNEQKFNLIVVKEK